MNHSTISNSGANLSILIQDEGRDSWASFAAWYSIHRYLPDAEMIVCRPRTTISMSWPNKCGIKAINYNPNKIIEQYNDFFVLPSYTMMIRPLRNNDLIIENCKDVNDAAFVRFKQCGKFDADLWNKHEKRPAIFFVDKLRNESMTSTEIKVLNMLQEMKRTFMAVERS